MDFGVVFQCDPPASEVVSLAQRAERAGFSHVWTFDSHVLWQEPFVIYSQILATTERVIVGPMVTNPSTRDWTVTASLFGDLHMYGPEGLAFYTRTKVVTSRWPDPATSVVDLGFPKVR